MITHTHTHTLPPHTNLLHTTSKNMNTLTLIFSFTHSAIYKWVHSWLLLSQDLSFEVNSWNSDMVFSSVGKEFHNFTLLKEKADCPNEVLQRGTWQLWFRAPLVTLWLLCLWTNELSGSGAKLLIHLNINLRKHKFAKLSKLNNLYFSRILQWW